MKKLFVHQPLFRLLSPVFSGVIVYLLVLLLNNNIPQIQEDFFNNELYFCIALSYLVQEFSRILLLLFKKTLSNSISVVNIVLQIVISMLVCITFSTFAIHLYFDYILGFSATLDEIIVFNSIFCVITFIYILLNISHQYLFKINTEKLHQEELRRQQIEEDFKQFKKGINPNLLFESFEALIILIHKDISKTDEFIDHLSLIYRYILAGKKEQLIAFSQELQVVNELVALLNYLPFRKIKIHNTVTRSFFVVPGALLFVVEQIVRTIIVDESMTLDISFSENSNYLEISYCKNDKITTPFSIKKIEEIEKTYQIYSTQQIEIIEVEQEQTRKIILPKLKIIA